MRTWTAVLALALVALAVPAEAQPPTFPHAYQLRGAVGDIPTTATAEPADAWNLEQRLTVQFSNATEATYTFTVPAGASVDNTTCTCNPSQTRVTATTVTFTLGTQVASGEHTMTLGTTQPAGDAIAFDLGLPLAAAPGDRIIILYVPAGSSLVASAEPTEDPLVSTSGTAAIHVIDGGVAPIGDRFWAAIVPGTVAQDTSGGGHAWAGWALHLALGLVAGALLWALLVSKGVVQAKSRRQVAATAAHVEAAAAEPAPVLEGRKRALLAALKEIEVAKMNNEMPNEVYDAVKADLKRQAVTVMRALETAQAQGETKA
jgi:hypothetical protein